MFNLIYGMKYIFKIVCGHDCYFYEFVSVHDIYLLFRAFAGLL